MYPTNLRTTIEACFNRLGIVTESYGGSAWTFTIANGNPLPVYAHIDEQWLCLDIPLNSKVSYRAAWSCLRAQPTLRGAVKFSFDAWHRRPHLQAEIPLIDDVAPDGPLHETLAGLHDALSKKENVSGPAETPEDSSRATKLLSAICSEAGWTCSRESGGSLSVEISARQGLHLAHLTPKSGGARVTAELLRTDEFEGLARFGLSILLLSAAREARWVRPYVEQQNTGAIAGFEVCFPALPGPTELSHAFHALSAAIKLCGEETMAIRDDSIARQFLLQRGQIQ
jgi:hypothetical protein